MMILEDEKEKALADIRSEEFTTYRATVPALEEILYKPIQVLDHGFVRLVDYMGDDNAIVQAARVSYGKGTKKVSEDRGLIQYLMRHWHTTPFEMCEVKFHIKLPIFVARQWIRHRTANVNEYSARYSVLSREFYIPAREHLAPQSAVNKQCREAGDLLSEQEAQRVLDLLKHDSELCYDHYLEIMNQDEQGNVFDENKRGIARELARMNLNLNYYTEWYWKIDLHNLLHFCYLRADSHAQYEIRVYADAILDIVKKWVPIAYESFMEYRVNGAHLSGKALKVVKAMIQGTKITQEESGIGKREWGELMEMLELN
jgi:thymidylate synthase (FAD)